MNLTSSEWLKIHQASARQWPDEVLSRAEICRRYVLVGVDTLKNLSDADRSRLAHELRSSMVAEDEQLRS